MASGLGPAQPRGVTRNGAGGSLIRSQSQHVIFSRTCWVTFHRRGITSSVSVIVSPSFLRCTLPQHAQAVGPRYDHALARQVLGEWLAERTVALESGNRGCLRGGFLGSDLVLGGGRLKVLEFQLHRIEEAGRVLRAGTVDMALELGDPKVLACDGRLVLGHPGVGSQCRDVFGLRIHATTESQTNGLRS